MRTTRPGRTPAPPDGAPPATPRLPASCCWRWRCSSSRWASGRTAGTRRRVGAPGPAGGRPLPRPAGRALARVAPAPPAPAPCLRPAPGAGEAGPPGLPGGAAPGGLCSRRPPPRRGGGSPGAARRRLPAVRPRRRQRPRRPPFAARRLVGRGRRSQAAGAVHGAHAGTKGCLPAASSGAQSSSSRCARAGLAFGIGTPWAPQIRSKSSPSTRRRLAFKRSGCSSWR